MKQSLKKRKSKERSISDLLGAEKVDEIVLALEMKILILQNQVKVAGLSAETNFGLEHDIQRLRETLELVRS